MSKNEIFDKVMKQIIKQVPKDKARKVCKNCKELGHNITSVKCKINIDKNNHLKNQIKKYVLSDDSLINKTTEEVITHISGILNITANSCRQLYNEIPVADLLEKKIDIEKYVSAYNIISCENCGANMIKNNTNRVWKKNIVCDGCWFKYETERNDMWDTIRKYKPIICKICDKQYKNKFDRFHYDHKNMFIKNDSVCSMVACGQPIDYILKEIDECQILCLCCHSMVTEIENKLGFTRIKQGLTRQQNTNKITEEEYKKKIIENQKIYSEKMDDIYEQLRRAKLGLNL